MKKKGSQSLISRQYEKRGLFSETWFRMRTNPGAVFGFIILALIILMMLYGIFFIDYDEVIKLDPLNRFLPSSSKHLLGTDDMGRDLLSRIVFGTRYSLAVSFGACAFGFVIGTFIGALGSYYGGVFEEVVMRASDVLNSIPALLLGMVIVTILGNSLTNLMIAVGTPTIPVFVRMTRAAVISVKNQEYVEAAKAIGMSNFRIVFTQVLPNSLSPLLVMLTMRLGSAILEAASLSFLGFGISAPTPEWGAMVSAGRDFIRVAPRLALYPGVIIVITTFACTLLGDGLRDALDPRLKK